MHKSETSCSCWGFATLYSLASSCDCCKACPKNDHHALDHVQNLQELVLERLSRTFSFCLCVTLLGLQLGGFDAVVMTLAAVTALVPPLEQLTPKKPEPISTDISARARLAVMGTMQAVTQILFVTFAAAQPQWTAGNHTAHQVMLRT